MPDDRLLLRNALLVDGNGVPARKADILLEGGTIVAVDNAIDVDGAATRLIDLGGATVTPGFIDVHSHVDNAPFLEGDDVSKILQGVTTEVVGNCGFSLAPRTKETGPVLENYALRLFPEVPWTWNSMRELFEAMDESGYVTHCVPLLGHHALRIATMGMEDRSASTADKRTMAELLDEAVAAGVFGLSTGLIYPPGVFSSHNEIAELVSRLPGNLIYATHLRGEGSQLQRSLAEATAVAEAADRQLQISHLKVAGRANWGTMNQALEFLDDARSRGLRISHDIYPYTAASTMLTATLPPWFQEGGAERIVQRLHHAPALEKLRRDLAGDDGTWENQVLGAGWSGIVVASSPSHLYDGMDLAAIGERLGVEPFDALIEVLVSEELRVSMIVHSMNEADLELALAHPFTMVGSDGLPPGTGGRPHPRMYGTFPRVLGRYVRERRLLTFEEAVRRMTALPAATFGLADRGVVEPGRAADLVVLDQGTIADRATYEDPTLPPIGISMVFQDGEISVQQGRYIGRRAGRRLVPS